MNVSMRRAIFDRSTAPKQRRIEPHYRPTVTPRRIGTGRGRKPLRGLDTTGSRTVGSRLAEGEGEPRVAGFTSVWHGHTKRADQIGWPAPQTLMPQHVCQGGQQPVL